MIRCQTCQHQEYTGALFCSECGMQLAASACSNQPQSNGSKLVISSIETQLGPDYGAGIPPGLSLKLLDARKIISMKDREEFTLGRASSDQPIIPDVDLSAYNAFDAGVSRLHASIRVSEGQVKVLDLGSSNGTCVNGQRIPPNIPKVLQNGDVLILGKFKIQIIIHHENE